MARFARDEMRGSSREGRLRRPARGQRGRNNHTVFPSPLTSILFPSPVWGGRAALLLYKQFVAVPDRVPRDSVDRLLRSAGPAKFRAPTFAGAPFSWWLALLAI